MKSAWMILGLPVLALGAADVAGAQPFDLGWKVIGFRTVRPGTDTDWLATPGALRFRQLRLCAENAPIHIVDVDVHFANGGHQDFDFANVLGAGGCTRALNLEGRRRDIARIRIKYERIARGAVVPLVRVSAR
jgi:hypothetical protein